MMKAARSSEIMKARMKGVSRRPRTDLSGWKSTARVLGEIFLSSVREHEGAKRLAEIVD
jgi:DNA polymerase III delta prime subunit